MGTKLFNLGSLFGDKDLQNMLGRVDTVVDSLSKQKRSNKTEKDVSDTALKEILSSLETEPDSDQQSDDNYEQLLEKLSISAVRLSRYKIYDEIYSSVQIVKRVIRTYINNCLQKDILTGTSINVKETDDMKDDNTKIEYNKYFIESIIKHYQLEKQLNDRVLHSVLRYGDHYIEIVDLDNTKEFIPMKKSNVITESSLKDIEYRLSSTIHNDITKRSVVNDSINKLYSGIVEISNSTDIDIDYRFNKFIFETTNNDKSIPKTNDNFDAVKLNRVILKFHKPHNIIVLSTDCGSIIGYVEIRELARTDITAGIGSRFATMINQLSSMSSKSDGDNSIIIDRLIDKLIKDLVGKIEIPTLPEDSSKNKQDINRQYEELLHSKLGTDLFYMIKKLFVEMSQSKNNKMKKISVRFIPNDKMVRFSHNPVEFFPYGTSTLDPLVYPGKLYLLTQLTNTVSKLSRASLIRKWTVETGPREHHSSLIQKLKRELRNQRVGVDDLMSFKSIPRILSDFKDIILLSKKGQRFVDMELQNMHDANIKVADLEDTRRELIALSGVPAPYLGYNDIIELREQLVHVNITFATEIVSIQDTINNGLCELVTKIGNIFDLEDPIKYVKPSLKPPIVLLLQMIETVMASISNIQQNFQTSAVDYDPFYMLKRYLPAINWDEFRKEAKEYRLLKNTEQSNTDTQQNLNQFDGGGQQ